jgi:hypothetical protein
MQHWITDGAQEAAAAGRGGGSKIQPFKLLALPHVSGCTQCITLVFVCAVQQQRMQSSCCWGHGHYQLTPFWPQAPLNQLQTGLLVTGADTLGDMSKLDQANKASEQQHMHQPLSGHATAWGRQRLLHTHQHCSIVPVGPAAASLLRQCPCICGCCNCAPCSAFLVCSVCRARAASQHNSRTPLQRLAVSSRWTPATQHHPW